MTPPISAPPTSSRGINFNVRVINPNKKKEYETYILRNATKAKVATPQLLQKELLYQFGNKIISSKQILSVGFMKSGSKVTIRSSADLDDVWQHALKGENITFWCLGTRGVNHGGSSDSTESDNELEIVERAPKIKNKRSSFFDEKSRRIDKMVTALKTKHGDRFTTIQYRLWAETLDVGTHR